VTRRNP
jgi:hypothetical protein